MGHGPDMQRGFCITAALGLGGRIVCMLNGDTSARPGAWDPGKKTCVYHVGHSMSMFKFVPACNRVLVPDYTVLTVPSQRPLP